MRFARAVKKRAAGSCERCGKTGVPLQAHHLIPGNDDPGYGRALCAECHEAVDPYVHPRKPRDDDDDGDASRFSPPAR